VASNFDNASFQELRSGQESGVEDDDGVAKIPGREWRPKVHHVWDELIDELLPPDGSGRLPAGSFQEFFRVVVDGG
jgi:DNA polymerase phi